MTLVCLLLRFFARSVSSVACSESPEASHPSLSSELGALCKLGLTSKECSLAPQVVLRLKSCQSEMLASWLLGTIPTNKAPCCEAARES